MKKTFLIFGALGAILATNGYAVGSQTVVVDYTCPAGCELRTITSSDGSIIAFCSCEGGTEVEPQITIKDLAPSPSTIREVMSQSTLNQAAMKNAKKVNKVSARAAETPKMVKKIVYEEIISDDDAE